MPFNDKKFQTSINSALYYIVTTFHSHRIDLPSVYSVPRICPKVVGTGCATESCAAGEGVGGGGGGRGGLRLRPEGGGGGGRGGGGRYWLPLLLPETLRTTFKQVVNTAVFTGFHMRDINAGGESINEFGSVAVQSTLRGARGELLLRLLRSRLEELLLLLLGPGLLELLLLKLLLLLLHWPSRRWSTIRIRASKETVKRVAES